MRSQIREDFIFKENMEMIVAIELKICVANTCIFGIVFSKISYKKKSRPIILLLIDESIKLSFSYTILSFILAVCLWIKYNRDFLLNTKKII